MNPAENTIMPMILIIRIIFQCLGVVFYGFLKLILPNTTESSQFIGIHYIRITLDSLITVCLSTSKVVKVILGHTTEEPRFIKIRLCSYSLIKIVHGQHIILIIKGRPADVYQSVGVKLGLED